MWPVTLEFRRAGALCLAGDLAGDVPVISEKCAIAELQMSNRSSSREPVSARTNQVSTKKFWIWEIRDWRPDAQTNLVATDEPSTLAKETDEHSRKRRKSTVFS
jgi:hypothetical protein